MPTVPKKPQDHKPKEEPKPRPEDTPGWDLMRPLEEIPVWEQLPLIEILGDLEDDADGDKEEILAAAKAKAAEENRTFTEEDEKQALKGHTGKSRSFNLAIVSKLSKALMDYAVDPEEYRKFASGPGALSRTTNLAFAWVGRQLRPPAAAPGA